LNSYVNTLQANGVADYNAGFKFAFEQFEQVILIFFCIAIHPVF